MAEKRVLYPINAVGKTIYRAERHYWRDDIEEWDFDIVGHFINASTAKIEVSKTLEMYDVGLVYETIPDKYGNDQDTDAKWELQRQSRITFWEEA